MKITSSLEIALMIMHMSLERIKKQPVQHGRLTLGILFPVKTKRKESQCIVKYIFSPMLVFCKKKKKKRKEI